MTNQEAFDRAARHLLTQRRVSQLDGVCMYRDPGGLKCAVGALIPDSEYSESLEGTSLYTLCSQNRLPPSLARADVRFLDDLQYIHDQKSPESWASRLLTLAAVYGLRVVIPLPTYEGAQ